MKKFCIAFAMIALLLCFTVSPASAQAKGKCAGIYVDWSGVGNYIGPYYFWFDANGTFVNEFTTRGVWYDDRGARVFIFDKAPHAFYAGKKTIGYMRTDDTVWGGLPGVWYSKGVKKTLCSFAFTTTAAAAAETGQDDPTNPTE